LRQSKLAAAEALEGAQREGFRLSIDDRLLLARLHDSSQNRLQAQTVMRDLIAEKPKESRFLRILLEMMLSYQLPASSLEPWVVRLERLAPNDPFTITCRARLMDAAGEKERALAMLEKLAPRPFDEKQAARVRLVAATLEEIGQIQPAEKLLAELIEKVPAARLDLARLLGRQGQIGKALDQCQAAVKEKVSWSQVIETALAVVEQNRSRADEQDLQRLRPWSTEALHEQPKEHALQLAHARVLGLLGLENELVEFYRALLANAELPDRETAIVQNNLAYMTAVRQLSQSQRTPTSKAGTAKADTKQEDASAALALSDKAIAVLGPNAQLRDTRGLALLAAGRAAEAIEEFQQALKEQRTGLTYYHLALAQLAGNNKKAAAEAMDSATKAHHLQPAEIPSFEQAQYREMMAKLKEG